jgi:hypothetical protein
MPRGLRIGVIGAGPAGLLFALLAKRRNPHNLVVVLEQNAPDATFGFGVVFSAGALAFLERDVPAVYAALTAAMPTWPMQKIVHREEAVIGDGNGFSAIARLGLQLLQRWRRARRRRCSSATRSTISRPSRASTWWGADINSWCATCTRNTFGRVSILSPTSSRGMAPRARSTA